jgi:iron complex transport system ATP-binding protein
MSPVIRLNQVSCAYPRTPVLRNLTFQVDPGELFIVIGPNGSGKTTLIKALAGLLPISGGELFFRERLLNRHKKKDLARQVAYVAQTDIVDSPFTLGEMVLMGRSPYLGILGIQGEKDLEIARQAIAFTGVSHLAGRRLNRLSGGERQRATIARAICQQPELILLDEPTAALDLSHQIRIMDLMEKMITGRRTTVVMVSHDINLAAMYADRLLLLVGGRMTACGPPSQVINQQILSKAYNCEIMVDCSPAGPWPRVNLMRHDRKQFPEVTS